MSGCLKPLLCLVAIAAGYWLWPVSELRHAPGILVATDPRQSLISPKSLPARAGFNLSAVAEYQLTARVLHSKRYWSGPSSDLVPVDLALGWGAMSDQAVLDRLEISQTNRFFFYEWQGAAPLDPLVMQSHASNVHVIAADDVVASVVSALHQGELVAMRGYLVNASTLDGGYWKTSLSRTDTGNGACELFYVTGINVVEAAF